MDIRILSDKDTDRWEQFVEGCPDATFFHKAGWKKVLELAYGHKTHFLFAEQDGEIEGVLPLGHIKSFLFGNHLTSTPFCVYGGIAATTDAARDALKTAACQLADDLRVDHLELRNLTSGGDGWPTKDLYVTFKKEIDADSEVNLKNIPRKQRAMVRKGIKAGLHGEIDGDIERLYQVYSESVRNLGTPVFPKKYFKVLQSVFKDDCDILTITKDGELVASVLSFYFRDQVLPYYGGGLASARSVQGNDFLYWELMCRAAERGCRVFDFGRSKEGTGSYSFKKHWGFEPTPLYYEFYLVKATELPDLNPLNPKYQRFIKLWKKLPVAVSQRLGPFLSRSLG